MRSLTKKGVTLIELLIVLLILALSSGLVIPRILSGLPSFQFRSAVNRSAALLRHMRLTAITTNHPVKGLIDSKSKEIAVQRNTSEKGSSLILPKTLAIHIFVHGKEIPGPFTFTFYPYGVSPTFSILLIEDGHSAEIHLDPLTGRPEIRRPHR
jgi:prepilin-type N-terminal cleavage/methylation domain-containing protein